MSRRGRAVVAGAGAVGACTALALAADGWEVALCDPAPLGANASGVAAGMLAAAFECVLEPDLAAHYGLLAEAQALWRDEPFRGARAAGPDGAIGLADEATLAGWVERFAHLGVTAERIDRPSGLQGPGPALRVAEDQLLFARETLERLLGALTSLGGRVSTARVLSASKGRAHLDNGASLEADIVVACTGAARDLAPELAGLQPVKGQIVRLEAVAYGGPTVRTQAAYVVSAPGGAMVGATMEPGRSDLVVDPTVVQRLAAAAASIVPSLAGGRATGLAGVRAATPDKLPLVGLSARPGVLVAAGARRNGWLLAPLMAREIAGLAAGRTPGRHASTLAAGRFS